MKCHMSVIVRRIVFVCVASAGASGFGQPEYAFSEEAATYSSLWAEASSRMRDTVDTVEGWAGSDNEVGPSELEAISVKTGVKDPNVPRTDLARIRENDRGDVAAVVARARVENWRAYAKGIAELLKDPNSSLLTRVADRKTKFEKTLVVSKLASLPHKASVPLIMATAKNAEEPSLVRASAVSAIATIPHDAVIGSLLEFLSDDDPRVAGTAFRALWTVTGYNPFTDEDAAIDIVNGFDQCRALFEEWIEENPEFEYSWYRARYVYR